MNDALPQNLGAIGGPGGIPLELKQMCQTIPEDGYAWIDWEEHSDNPGAT